MTSSTSRKRQAGRAAKRYTHGPIHMNAVQRAIEGASKLPSANVANTIAALNRALIDFCKGADCADNWACMADALNVGEALAELNICSDEASRERIEAGMSALAEVATRHAARNSWTLYSAERTALDDALWLHGVQLQHASFREYERAIELTKQRVSQAIAGNAGAGTRLVGALGQQQSQARP